MNKQYHLFFSGTVQGVGFRFTSQRLAQKYNLAGWVKNLKNGGVEIVAEAEAKDLNSFLSELKDEFRHNIANLEKKEGDYTGKYQNFEISF